MKKQTIPIKGMHCQSCEVLISEELEALPDVEKTEVSLKTKTATVYVKHIVPRGALERAIQAAGYEIGYEEKPRFNTNKRVLKDFVIGLGVVVVLVLLFAKLGLGNVANINVGGASIGLMALVVGLTAGFSTCMAMIGGLVLGVSSRHAEKHPTASPIQKFRPHLFFNLGRIVSFIVLGAVIGGLGAAFQFKGSILGLLTLAVGIVMLMLGLQLTELFPRLKGTFTLPSSIGKLIGIKKHSEREYSHKDAFLMGAVTFFLPCGFTQAMQLFAVSTGNPVSGAIVMGMFAIGTAPGLLSIGGLTSVVKGVFAQRFFRVVGVVVVMMAVVNIGNAYSLLGVNRILSGIRLPAKTQSATTQLDTEVAPQQDANSAPAVKPTGGVNILSTTYRLRGDISPNTFTTKVGQETTLEVDVKDNGQGCMSTIMIPGLDDNPQYLKAGKKLKLNFMPSKAGTYEITCAMGVPRGKIKVES